MRTHIILKVISVILGFVMIGTIVGASTASGSGFMDLSNIVKIVCIGIAVVCGILAVLVWKFSKSKE